MLKLCVLMCFFSAVVAHLDGPDCVRVSDLPDFTVQRAFGERRQVNKVRLHLSGSGHVDVGVSVAVGFFDDDINAPVLHECNNYDTAISDGVLDISCREDDPQAPRYGLGRYAYAVYVQFGAEQDVLSDVSICRLDIVLRDRTAELKEEMIYSVGVFSGVLSALIALGAIGVIVWYFMINRKRRVDSDFEPSIEFLNSLDDRDGFLTRQQEWN